jgi:hypothetical protein
VLVFRTRYQVDESFASFQRAECGALAAVQQLESKFLVEADGTSHVMDGEGHCTDVLDHPSRFHSPEYGRVLSAFQLGDINLAPIWVRGSRSRVFRCDRITLAQGA